MKPTIRAMILTLLAFSTYAWAGPNQNVMGYSATWFDGIYSPQDYNYDSMTHLVRSFLTPKADGSITVPDNFFNASMESLARAHGVKLLMSLGGEAPDASNWLSMARNPKSLERFLGELAALVKDHAYDGVDIDWEPSALTSEDGVTYTDFLKALRARFPKLIITVALGGSEYWVSHFDWSVISSNVDFVNAMVYDFSGPWSEKSAYDSNLHPAGDYPAEPGVSVQEEMNNLAQNHKVPRSKLMMGLTFWGNHFSVARMGDEVPKGEPGQGSQLSFSDVQRMLLGGGYLQLWDNKAGMPHLQEKNQGQVVAYEDERSIGLKCAYARDQGFAGVMIWNLGADVWGSRAPLMDAVAKACGATPNIIGRDRQEKQVLDMLSQFEDCGQKLQSSSEVLLKAGQKVPTPAPRQELDPSKLGSLSDQALEKLRLTLETRLGLLQADLEELQRRVLRLPSARGRKVDSDKPWVVDDFASGTMNSRLGTTWSVDVDNSHLGTILNNAKRIVSPGAEGFKHCSCIFGHMGKSEAPWSYVEMTCNLDSAAAALDLSDFKSVQFMARGDGKKYEVILDNPAVTDFANFRAEFVAPKEWTRVTLPLDSFHQPNWGTPVSFSMGAVSHIILEPSAMSDEDFDLCIDDLAFYP